MSTLIFSDDFSSGSSASDLSTSPNWTKNSGGTNGRLRYSNAGRLYGHFDACVYLAIPTPTTPDVSVSVDLTPITVVDNSRGGVIARFGDGDQYYRAEWHRNGSTNASERVALWRMGPSNVLLDSISTRALASTTYTLRMEIVGNLIKVFWNDAPRIEFTDSTPLNTVGSVGLSNRNYTGGSNTAGLHLDNFVALALGDTPPTRKSRPLFLVPAGL